MAALASTSRLISRAPQSRRIGARPHRANGWTLRPPRLQQTQTQAPRVVDQLPRELSA